MLVPFLIMFREGVEAALIVGIIATYLVQTGRGDALRHLWMGTALAAVSCLALGLALDRAAAEFPQRIQEAFEALIGLVAVVILTSMVFWMRRAGASMRAELHASVDEAFAKGGSRSALILMAFLAVAREGLESVFFLLAAFQQDVGPEAPVGAVLGLMAAVAFGAAIFLGGRRINVRRFFQSTGVLILFVAAGLAAGVVRSAHEAGLWNHLQGVVFDLSETLPADGVAGTLLSGLFGYRDAPTEGELATYLLFLVGTLTWYFRPPGGRAPLTRVART